MKLVVGLGNVGDEYTNNRHNVGFIFLDFLKDYLKLSENFVDHPKLNSVILKSKNIILVKPSTLMNGSGLSVQKVKNFYKISLEDLIIVHDDIDQKIGKYKSTVTGGSGGHKGVDSIKEHLGILDITRVKIGVAPEIYNPQIHKAEDFVLKNFNVIEQSILNNVFTEICIQLFNKE